MFDEDETFRSIFKSVRRIAVVGLSDRPERASHRVARFLQSVGYRIIPVNPTVPGSRILGEEVVARLSDLSEPVDMVDVFRRSRHVAGLVDEALALASRPAVFWTQLDIRDDVAAARAREAGITVVQDRCPLIEYRRLFGSRVLPL